MNNFASRMMMNILTKSAFEQGIQPDDLQRGSSDDYASALIPIDQKRDLLDDIVSKAGAYFLLQQDAGVDYYKNNPCLSALLYKATPEYLIQRWQRLERYIHSEHYIHIISSTSNSFIVEHKSQNNTPPTLAEDMAVMGVLKSLLKQSGAVQVQLDAVAGSLILADGSVKPCAWHFQWQRLLMVQQENSLLPNTAVEQLYASFPSELQHVARAIGFDDLFSPRLQQIASRLHLSSRSLQRKLLQHGATFSKLVQRNRLLKSSYYLLQSDVPLPEIGFLSGFSDQPHFCRVFKENIGMSPQVYRQIVNTR
jgi:AraC-like DNA-binding protein